MRNPHITTREQPPLTTTREKLCISETPVQQKINYLKNKNLKKELGRFETDRSMEDRAEEKAIKDEGKDRSDIGTSQRTC